LPVLVPEFVTLPVLVPVVVTFPVLVPVFVTLPVLVPVFVTLPVLVPVFVTLPALVPVFVTLPALVPVFVTLPVLVPVVAPFTVGRPGGVEAADCAAAVSIDPMAASAIPADMSTNFFSEKAEWRTQSLLFIESPPLLQSFAEWLSSKVLKYLRTELAWQPDLFMPDRPGHR
jgi:hypothetical protein